MLPVAQVNKNHSTLSFTYHILEYVWLSHLVRFTFEMNSIFNLKLLTEDYFSMYLIYPNATIFGSSFIRFIQLKLFLLA